MTARKHGQGDEDVELVRSPEDEGLLTEWKMRDEGPGVLQLSVSDRCETRDSGGVELGGIGDFTLLERVESNGRRLV